ncbi:MAG: phosphoribosylaminoimidazolesuccinocarboxamide synthase [Bacillota bacterium]|nr:MAG: phosphoribosylaminoimidazolesuccinocarboxamide synthase [Bacillota bacterium]
MTDVLLSTEEIGHIGLPLLHRGKVREVFDLGDRLLLVASDRLSAFDVVFAEGIPGKGRVLTELSALWFRATAPIAPNHFVSMDLSELGLPREAEAQLAGRSMIVKKTRRIDVECVVRGYLAGSGWKEYQRDGTVCGIPLPPGLELNSPLPEPIFTPALKVDDGHDENVPYEKVVELYGPETAAFLRDTSIRLYEFAAAKAAEAGIILADTKLEFGRLGDEIIVIDELFTPDSSRFWPRDRYVAGRPIDSLDKQPVRDYLESIGWNKEPPPPALPEEVAAACAARYREAVERLRAVLR